MILTGLHHHCNMQEVAKRRREDEQNQTELNRIQRNIKAEEERQLDLSRRSAALEEKLHGAYGSCDIFLVPL